MSAAPVHRLVPEARFDADGAPVLRTARPRGRGPIAATRATPLRLADMAAHADPAPSDGPPPAPEPPPPMYTQAELDRAVEEAAGAARGETEAAVRRELASSLEGRRTDALASLRAELATAATRHRAMLEARAGASRELALALARALVPRALARAPLADIEAMLRELVARLDDRPRLVVRLAPDLVEPARACFARLAEEAGYPGELAVVPEPALAPGDARVEWTHGAAERSLAGLEAEALALVDAWLPVETGAGAAAETRSADHRPAGSEIADEDLGR